MPVADQVPMVTVYMPTHNRLDLLQRAVASVLAQRLAALELIIVDDCSSDGTPAYLAALARQDARVRVLCNERNMGACASRNRAIATARGEFITGLDDDDFFLPHRLDSFLACWRRLEPVEPSCRGLYSNVYFMRTPDGEGRATQVMARSTRADLQRRNHVGNHVFTRTAWLREIGGFDPDFPAWQDYDTWYRLVGDAGCLIADPEMSYVVDDCHDGARISVRLLARFEQAHAMFCRKHGLSLRVATTLRNSVLEHPLASMGLRDLWRQVRDGDPLPAFRVFLLKHLPMGWRRVLLPRPLPEPVLAAMKRCLVARAVA